MGGLEEKLVNPSREGISSGSWKLLNCRVIRSGLGACAAWTVLLDCPRDQCRK